MSDGFAREGVQVRWGARPRKGMAMEERIVELELRFTEQQRLLQELSDVVYAQGQALGRVEHELAALGQKLAAFDPGLVDATVSERPPHF
ncbi:MAG: SlyX family protein [Myxococcaceae bacterium]